MGHLLERHLRIVYEKAVLNWRGQVVKLVVVVLMLSILDSVIVIMKVS